MGSAAKQCALVLQSADIKWRVPLLQNNVHSSCNLPISSDEYLSMKVVKDFREFSVEEDVLHETSKI